MQMGAPINHTIQIDNLVLSFSSSKPRAFRYRLKHESPLPNTPTGIHHYATVTCDDNLVCTWVARRTPDQPLYAIRVFETFHKVTNANLSEDINRCIFSVYANESHNIFAGPKVVYFTSSDVPSGDDGLKIGKQFMHTSTIIHDKYCSAWQQGEGFLLCKTTKQNCTHRYFMFMELGVSYAQWNPRTVHAIPPSPIRS